MRSLAPFLRSSIFLRSPVFLHSSVFLRSSISLRSSASLVLLLVLTLFATTGSVAAQEEQKLAAATSAAIEPLYGSLADLKERRRVLLLTNRNHLVDSRGSAHTVLASLSKPQPQRPAHPYAHNIIARRLNKYILGYRSLTAVRQVKDADFIIFFNVLRERPSFIPSRPFIYGEMFVILNGTPGDSRPRIVWRTQKELTGAEDAVTRFLKELKNLRRET